MCYNWNLQFENLKLFYLEIIYLEKNCCQFQPAASFS